MKKGLKRKKGEPICGWMLRAAEKVGMTKEQFELLVSVQKESYDEGMAVGEHLKSIKQIKNNNHETD